MEVPLAGVALLPLGGLRGDGEGIPAHGHEREGTRTCDPSSQRGVAKRYPLAAETVRSRRGLIAQPVKVAPGLIEGVGL